MDQLILKLQPDTSSVFENYYTGKNEPLINEISSVEKISSLQQVFIWGGKNLGKSHLLQATCSRFSSEGRNSVYLPMKEIKLHNTSIIDGLESISLICIDDISEICGNRKWELAVFNLINSVRATKNCILISSDQAPDHLKITLADLKSRFSWGPVYKLQELNDAQQVDAIALRASFLGFDLPKESAKFLQNHLKRDMQHLSNAVLSLEKETLVQQRKITIPFIKSVLDI
jgi:DnaA family protein